MDVKKLLEAGAHFGHRTSRWHPKMAPYIHSKRDGIHIIDLIKTKDLLDQAVKFVEAEAAKGNAVLFVGTKRQAKQPVKVAAEKAGMPYIIKRWLGGMLTNTDTMKGRIKRLKDLEQKMDSGELAQRYSKLEVQRFQEEIDKLNDMFGGIKEMDKLPSAIFIADIQHDDLAVDEANTLKIPVIALIDTNSNPDKIDFPIPANDDAIKTIALVADALAEATNTGKAKVKAQPKSAPKPKAKPKAKPKTKTKTAKKAK